MPSFQSPEPMSGSPCAPTRDSALDGPHAVLVQARRFARARRQVVVGVVLGVHRAAVEEVDRLVEHRGIPGAQHVARRSPGQPEVIVRAMRAHAAARGRMPPVLHVAFAELMRRAAQQVLAGEARLGMDQRHDVLQLVAEAESAARLVMAAARPKAARQRLVHEPAVRQQVEGRGRAFPPAPRPGCAPSIARTFASATRRRCAGLRPAPTPSVKTISRSSPSASSKATCSAPQGSSPAPTLFDSCARRIAAGFLSVPLRPRNSVRSPLTRAGRIVDVKERSPVGELGVVGVGRVERAARRIDLGDHVHRRFRPQVAQHPLDVAGGGEPARAGPSGWRAFSTENLTGCFEVHVHAQLGADAVFGMLEDAVAEAVPRDVGRGARRRAAASATRTAPLSSSRR